MTKRKTRPTFPIAREGGVMKNVLIVLLAGLVIYVGVLFRSAGISADQVTSVGSGKMIVTVEDESSRAISQAVVQVQSDDSNKKITLSSKDGHYQNSIPSGRYTVQVSARGYQPSTLYTIVKSGEAQELTIQLSR